MERDTFCERCSNDCFDYHRICPAVKNQTFYDEYKQLHEDGKLSVFNNAEIPPEPACNDSFYQYACPRSCGICTVCEVIDLATLNQLEDKLRAADEAIKASLTAKIDAIPQDDDYDYGYDYDDYSNSGCNRCTERVDHNAIPVSCKPKYDVIYELGECSCNCGHGTQIKKKKCVAYVEKFGGEVCETIITHPEFCPGPATTTEKCHNGDCTVAKILEKTATVEASGTIDVMTYRAVTASGQSCQLGVVQQEANKLREQGDGNLYLAEKGEIEHPVCGELCMAKNEVFDYIEITTSGNDAWRTYYIEVTVNGVKQKYSNKNLLENKDTQKYPKMN